MSEMVDRVKAALMAGGTADEQARAVIKAMREPTLEMCDAYERAMRKYISKLPPDVRRKRHYAPKGYMVPEAIKIKIRYQAMIDEALK